MLGESVKRRQYSFGALLVLVTFTALVFAGVQALGTPGLVVALMVGSVSWYYLSRFKSTALLPLNRRQISKLELVVMLANCIVILGLTLDEGQRKSHGRPPIPTTPAANTGNQQNSTVSTER